MSSNDKHGNIQQLVHFMDVNDIKPCKRNPLEHHQLYLRGEFGTKDEFSQPASGVCTITSYQAADNAIKSCPGEDSSDDPHVAAVGAPERVVIETDDIREGGVCHKR